MIKSNSNTQSIVLWISSSKTCKVLSIRLMMGLLFPSFLYPNGATCVEQCCKQRGQLTFEKHHSELEKTQPEAILHCSCQHRGTGTLRWRWGDRGGIGVHHAAVNVIGELGRGSVVAVEESFCVYGWIWTPKRFN